MKKNYLSHTCVLVIFSILFAGALFSCKKGKDPLQIQTDLLCNKNWRNVSRTLVPEQGSTEPVYMDTASYALDDSWVFTSDGRWQIRDGELKTPGVNSDVLIEGFWRWQDNG